MNRIIQPFNTKELIERLDIWLRKHRADFYPKLNPGATDDDLKQLESRLGVTLPADFAKFLKWKDGQPQSVVASFHPLTGEMLMSVESILQTWEMMNKLVKYGDISGESWSATWIPFLDNGGGDCSFVDSGGDGRILYRNHETEEVEVVNDNFKEWLTELVLELETNNFSEWDDIEEHKGA